MKVGLNFCCYHRFCEDSLFVASKNENPIVYVSPLSFSPFVLIFHHSSYAVCLRYRSTLLRAKYTVAWLWVERRSVCIRILYVCVSSFISSFALFFFCIRVSFRFWFRWFLINVCFLNSVELFDTHFVLCFSRLRIVGFTFINFSHDFMLIWYLS